VTNIGTAQSDVVHFGLASADLARFEVDYENLAGDPDACGFDSGTSSFTTQLSPGQFCDVYARFNPAATGNKHTLVVASANPGGTVSSAVSGTGIQSHLRWSPATLTFAPTHVGTVAVGTLQTTLTNDGTYTTGVIGFGASPGFFSDFGLASADPVACSVFGQVLGVGESCNAAFSFSPSAAGDRKATVTATDGPVTGVVNLVGKGLLARLDISPVLWNFGTGGSKVFTLKNNGTDTSSAISLDKSVTGFEDDFEIDDVAGQPTCAGATLAKGASCKFMVTFTGTVGNPGDPEDVRITANTGDPADESGKWTDLTGTVPGP
jgi:hypothetical protein